MFQTLNAFYSKRMVTQDGFKSFGWFLFNSSKYYSIWCRAIFELKNEIFNDFLLKSVLWIFIIYSNKN